jgi:hypothetical protein
MDPTFTLNMLIAPTPSTLSNNAANFPAELLIPFTPESELITYDWNGALDVLNHLLLQPHERNKLRTEARRRNPHHAQTFFIQHYHLTTLLTIDSFDSDYLFVRTIKCQIINLERHRGNSIPELQTVIQPLNLPFLLDPFDLLANPQETAQNIGRYLPFPCEILILPEGPQVKPLLSYETIAYRKLDD